VNTAPSLARRVAVVGGLAAGLLLPVACGKPYEPAADEVAGSWCSDDGDVITLNPDGWFTATHLSLRFAEILLPADGYVDDYRIKTEYGGKVPPDASGKWSVFTGRGDALDVHGSGVDLELGLVGDQTQSDGVSLYFDGDEATWGFAVEHGGTFWRYIDRCDPTQPPPSVPESAPTGWPKQ
jgi:hypothetical protein